MANSFETLACLIAHASVEAAFESSSVQQIIEYQNTDKISGWDSWIQDSNVSTTIDGRVGRVRARAWGVSNPFNNFRALAGARFRFRFVIRPDQIVFDGGLYRFDVGIRMDGRFLHTPAVPYPSDSRSPPATTAAQISTRLLMTAFDLQGNIKETTVYPFQNVFSSERTPADAGDIDSIPNLLNSSREFILRDDRYSVFDIINEVLAGATGEFSDCRIRGTEGRSRFRVRVQSARIQKVLLPDDVCFDVLKP